MKTIGECCGMTNKIWNDKLPDRRILKDIIFRRLCVHIKHTLDDFYYETVDSSAEIAIINIFILILNKIGCTEFNIETHLNFEAGYINVVLETINGAVEFTI